MRVWRGQHTVRVDDAMLQRIHVFALVSRAERARLLLDARCVAYPQGEEVDITGDEQRPQLLAVAEGAVRIDVRQQDGSQMPIHAVEAGGVIVVGQEGWVGPGEAVVTTLRESTLCSLPLPLAEEVIDACPAARRALRSAERRLLREVAALASGQFHGPEGRIRHVLLLDTRYRGSVDQTHEYLAARARTDRPKVSRVLGKLVQDGVIAVDQKYHRITILDRARLADSGRS